MKTELNTITKEMTQSEELANSLNQNLEKLNESINKVGTFFFEEFKVIKHEDLQKLNLKSNNTWLDFSELKKEVHSFREEMNDFRTNTDNKLEETNNKLEEILRILKKPQ